MSTEAMGPKAGAGSAPATPSTPPAASPPAASAPAGRPHARRRRIWRLLAALVAVSVAAVFGFPRVREALTTVSTDDAYVNDRTTFVAPRVSGQIEHVFVDDHNRVRKGDLLVQLDRELYQTEVRVAHAAVAAAEAELVSAQAQARSIVGQVRASRFRLDHAVEDVHNQLALLHVRVATLESQKATQTRARAEVDRATPLVKSGGISAENFDSRKENLAIANARVEEALQAVYQIRVSLGLAPKPEIGDDLAQVPSDIDQTTTSVRQAQGELIKAASELGVVTSSFDQSPKDMIAEFLHRDSRGDVDKIYQQLLERAPVVLLAQAKAVQAQRSLEQAQLNLSYTDITAEIDGIITHRDVNPGNHVMVGQSLMTIRSLDDVWIDANFKETQLEELRIGQPVDIDVDMYGSHRTFRGRISGFTFGTGSTLALLPAQNATGNYVKVVQRLPVRIDLFDYDPDVTPLFPGLSVTPRVRIKDPPTGPNAGQFLQARGTQPVTTRPTAPDRR